MTAESASLGEGAVVLAGADVGTGARLTKCIVFPGAPVPAGAQLHGGIWHDGSFSSPDPARRASDLR